MSKSPVVLSQDPATSEPQTINLRGVPPDPATFDGPLNEFIELHGTAVAFNTAAKTLADYPAPPADPVVNKVGGDFLKPPPYLALRPAAPVRTGPISAGHAVVYTRGVLDRTVGERVRNRKYPHKDPRP